MGHNTWTLTLSSSPPSFSSWQAKTKCDVREFARGPTERCASTFQSRVLFFVPLPNLPPRLRRQGHYGRLCVFCLESFSRLFGDEVVVHKRATPGSGLQPWRWFITRHGGRRGLMTLPRCCAVWNQEVFFKNVAVIVAVSPSGDLFYCTGTSFQ